MPVHSGHLQVDQADVRLVRTELLNRFSTTGSFRYDFHVWLATVDRENPNHVGVSTHVLLGFPFLKASTSNVAEWVVWNKL